MPGSRLPVIKSKRWYLLVAAPLVIAFLYSNSLLYFSQFYPNWVNTELLINYSGGFVRRGLLGQLALLARDTFGVAPDRFFFYLFSALYFAQMFCFLWLSSTVRRKTFLLLLILSPALLLFPAYDPNAFGRKDVFITLGLLLHAILVAMAHKSDMVGKHYATLFLLLISPFILATVFIHEVQAFFLMHHIILTLLAPPGRSKKLVLPGYLLVAFAIPAVILNPGGFDKIRWICNSWSLGKAYCDGGIYALAWGIKQSADLSMRIFMSPEAVLWWIAAFFLSAIPLVLCFGETNGEAREILIRRVPKPLLATAGIMPLFLFFIGWDFGRWIHLYFIGIFSTLMPLLAAGRDLHETVTIHNQKLRAIYWGFVFCYITLWRLPHCCLIESLGGGFLQQMPAAFFPYLGLLPIIPL